MYRIVLDTNVIVSAATNRGRPRDLLRMATQYDKYTLVTSNDILEEVKSVLNRPKFNMDGNKITEFVNNLASLSDISTVRSGFRVVEDDPDDDIVVNTAYDGDADYIVSGDSGLLRVKGFGRIQIVGVAEMLQILGKAP